MKRRLRIGFYGLLVICAALLLICNQLVISNAEGRLFDEVETVPEGYSFGLLLGTTPQTRISHRRNMFFESRIHATASLYHAGKIQKVLISGDDNSLDGINEVECMRDSLLERGIPPKDGTQETPFVRMHRHGYAMV